VTRRTLTKKDIDEGDFRAYIASSSGSESDSGTKPPGQSMGRNKLRALLLGGGGEDLPEGWGNSKFGVGTGDEGDVDMEVTFMPALSSKADEDETTLEKYQRKLREKRKKRKEEWKVTQAADEGESSGKAKLAADDFFGDTGDEASETEEVPTKGGKHKGKKVVAQEEERRPSTQEELALLATADGLGLETRHFDLKAVVKAEKGKKGKRKRPKRSLDDDGPNELQEGFSINVKDERFQALHEDYNFAIDPSNPR
jgi:hypothetical protein